MYMYLFELLKAGITKSKYYKKLPLLDIRAVSKQ